MRRINWKAILMGFCWIVCLSGVGILMSFVEVKKQEVKCVDVKILIPGADNFIEREEIDAILLEGFGKLTGQPLEKIHTQAIEERLKLNPYVAFVKVFAEMDGVLKISVKQRQPVLRVINAGNQDFYVDSEGLKMPVSSNFTANVLVATGNITEAFYGRVEKISSKMLFDLYKTAVFIKKDTLWDAQFEQLYVDERSDIELVPRVGMQKIVIGNADMLEVKMNNLLIFYKKAMPKVGWEAYKSINVKYKDQIVCEKNKPDSLKVQQPPINDNLMVANGLQDSVEKQEVPVTEIKKIKADNETATIEKRENKLKKLSPDKTL